MANSFSIQTFDDRRNILIPGDSATTVKMAAQHILDQASEAIEARGRFTWALSGGSTPQAIYQCIASEPNRDAIDWTQVWLFWSDERCVPPDHPDSNYRMAMDAGLNSLGIPSKQIFRMHTETQLFAHTADYEELLVTTCEEGCLDFIMLGMGEDGHTASLFPYTHALNAKEQLVTANYIPKLQTWRMSFTYNIIDLARNTVIYALGASKAPMIAEVFGTKYDPMRLPVQRVGTEEHHALWVLDKAAAQPLLNRATAN